MQIHFYVPAGFLLKVPSGTIVSALSLEGERTVSFSRQSRLFHYPLRWLNTVLAVCECMLFSKSWQEKGCSSQAETWQVENILMKDFD